MNASVLDQWLARESALREARLLGPDGTLYAHATTTCLVFDLPTASKP